MTKEISLTQGKVALVSDQDYAELSRYKWYAQRAKYTWYARRKVQIGYKKQATIVMHRQILGVDGPTEIDHIDHDGLNNTRENLRLCTRSENQQNRRVLPGKSKGVTWHRREKKWYVHIGLDGKRKHVGRFDSLDEATAAYDAAAKKYYGEFAQPNMKEKA